MTCKLSEETILKPERSMDEDLDVGSSNPPHRTIFRDRHLPAIGLSATWTPDWLANDMVALADIRERMTVLEPSAGTGQIVRAIHRRSCGVVTAVELNALMASCLYHENCRQVIRGDFLKTGFGEPFDRVVMNPPMDAVPHIRRAAAELKRGGRLVALVHAIRVSDLGRSLPGMRSYCLPDETFVIPTTGGGEERVPSSMIVWDRP